MSELVPSALFDAQALKVLEALLYDRLYVRRERDLTPDELIAMMRVALEKLVRRAGLPLFEHLEVRKGEPPDSRKINDVWNAISADVHVAQYQLDLNRAAAVSSFNQITTELSKAQLQNRRIENKIKSLQLYAEGTDDDTIMFADRFRSLEGLDTDFVDVSMRPALLSAGNMTLALEGSAANYATTNKAKIRILEDVSNGFSGRNQLATEVGGIVTFIGDGLELDHLDRMLDDEPNTWFEYEVHEVSEAVRNSVNGFGFEYIDPEDDTRIDWADGTEGGVLRLAVEVTFNEIQDIDEITLTPHRITGINKALPYRVKGMQVSQDGTDWDMIAPVDVVFGLDSNLTTLRASDEAMIGAARWSFNRRPVKRIRFLVEQSHSRSVEIGHAYWVDSETEARIDGIIPKIDRVEESRKQNNQQKMEQRFEILPGERWAIALKDIEVRRTNYVTSSIFVSRPLEIDGVIDRVVLDFADYDIPEDFDTGERWVKFYISADEGVNWHEIVEVEDVGGIDTPPEVVSFNDPLPEALRESRVKNIVTTDVVNRLRVKIEVIRPQNKVSATPVVRGYGLKVLKR